MAELSTDLFAAELSTDDLFGVELTTDDYFAAELSTWWFLCS